jgi:ATP-dependent Zn protease
MKKMAMHESVNLVSTEDQEMSSQFNGMLEQEAGRLLEKLMGEASNILAANKDKVELLANELMNKETLDLKQIKNLLGIKD